MNRIIPFKPKISYQQENSKITEHFFYLTLYSYEIDTFYKCMQKYLPYVVENTVDEFTLESLEYSFRFVLEDVNNGKYKNDPEIPIYTHIYEIGPLIHTIEKEITFAKIEKRNREIRILKSILNRLKDAQEFYCTEIQKSYTIPPLKLLRLLLEEWNQICKGRKEVVH